ncbi:MAG: hypothetical protein LCH68_00620 [Proteobacteria bacterium]|nr:hypothetical protein [Pseudomonadota bacterium]
MNARTAPLLAAVLAAAPFAAQADDSVAQLARETGLTERNVRMVLGARTPYAEYRVVYNRVERQFKRAVGEDNFDRLMRGESVVIERASTQEAVAAQVRGAASAPPTRLESPGG